MSRAVESASDERGVELESLLPPTAEADGTLRRFLQEAVLQFAARGYAGVSIREIAEPIGVKPSAMYAHFPSKEAVLQALVDIAHRWFDEQLGTAVRGAGTEPEARLRALVDANVRFHAQYPRLATVANFELRNLSPTSLRRAVKQRQKWEQLAEQIIADGVATGTFGCADPTLAMRAIGAMCIRVSAWIEREDTYSVDDIVFTYTDYVLRIVA